MPEPNFLKPQTGRFVDAVRAGQASERQSPARGSATAPLRGAALIMYGLIRQRVCSECEG